MSDSLMIEVTGVDKKRLVDALNLAPVDRITGVSWLKNSLVLRWEHDHNLPQKLAFEPALMADLILEWLGRDTGYNSNYAAPVWPDSPDIDGSVKKGWLVEGDGDQITVHPHWMIYHK